MEGKKLPMERRGVDIRLWRFAPVLHKQAAGTGMLEVELAIIRLPAYLAFQQPRAGDEVLSRSSRIAYLPLPGVTEGKAIDAGGRVVGGGNMQSSSREPAKEDLSHSRTLF